MDLRRPLAALLLLAAPAAAQTAKPPAGTAPAAGTPPTQASSSPAPMPDPLMSPDLQAQGNNGRPPTFAALVQQPAWQDPLLAAARAQAKQLPGECAAASFKPSSDLIVYVQPQFSPQGALTQGIWSERVDETGCGAPRQLNILTVLQPGAAPTRIPTMPGSTHADPSTQKTALEYAQAVAVRASPPNCRTQSFINTRFDGYTGLPNPEITDGRQSRAWREVWTLYACGSTYDIELTFTPNSKGMQLVGTNPVKRS